MLFSEVTTENIKQAVNDINKKGVPDGFSTSKYYDVKIDGAFYPPKPVMAIANYYATGTEIGNYFSGGIETPCFKAYERLGIPIVEKSNNSDFTDLFEILVSSNYQDDTGNYLKAKLQVLENSYTLLKGSYLYKKSKPSFKDHSYNELVTSYSNHNYVKETSFNEFQILKKDILFTSSSAAASMVLKRAANGPSEWKTENGLTLRELENKVDFHELLQSFLQQAKTDNLKTKHYPKFYKDLKIRVSFGAGNQAMVPWVAFLEKPNKVTDGIYPVYLYFKSVEKLILAYGLSVTNTPKINWELTNPISIADYFINNNLGKPDRYGNSYVYKVYDANNLPNAITINEDLESIIFMYQNITVPAPVVSETKSLFKKEKFVLSGFIDSTAEAGLYYSSLLITRFISSLVTKPFVLLSGLSGSGKSKLAEAFAKWICEDEDQYALIPVGADWTNREPLLGYPNALKDNEYVKPDNDALDLLIRATKNDKKPYFLILDEMNLSHVERYFADFLSTMESNNYIPLHKIENEVNAIPRTIRLPKNLFIVGTVNIDETTYMFSPKVLDRANTIEFRVDNDEIESFLNNPTDVDLEKLNGSGTAMSRSFVRSATQMDDDGNKIVESYGLDPETQKIITSFFKELQKSGAEFGYRTAFEMSKLIFKLKEFGLTEINQQLDIAIMQKMLPKLHGSRSKLSRTLKPLAKLCLYNVEDFDKKYFENFKNIDFKKDENIKYRLSFEKIMRLFNNAVENGFASYAEA